MGGCLCVARAKGVYLHVSVNDMHPLELCRATLGEASSLGFELVHERDGVRTLFSDFKLHH